VIWDGHSLFQHSALRTVGAGFKPPTVVTAEDYRFVASEHLREIGLETRSLLIEPSARNTAPAILAATLNVMRDDPEAVILVAPGGRQGDAGNR